MKKFVNGFMVVMLAGMLVYAANQASETRQAGWFILLGVQVVFFFLAIVQAAVTHKEQ